MFSSLLVDTRNKGCRQAEEGSPIGTMLACGTPDAVDGYQWQAKQTAAQAVLEAKTRVWEEFGEAMEEDYHWLASKKFWQTSASAPQKGKQYSADTAVYSIRPCPSWYLVYRTVVVKRELSSADRDESLWCLLWLQPPNPVVDTRSKGCRQAEEGILLGHVGLWDS
ncbi:hypothetical protein L3Q82_003036 [Scortum barcoo]|uniref:Uncharacterized protein n=1 Tax=Scortum barcoo TaxID=214431 RepID=A0ACB8VQR9_9TELE|nr:hypothetical protein L3Q82_003036 [Scortum barcoo]